MDYSSKEAKKLLRDYYYWKTLCMDKNTRDVINFVFGYEDTKNHHDNIDHTLEIKRGIEKGILSPPVDRTHGEVITELIEVRKTIKLEDTVNGFLYSLSTGKNEYRTALASLLFANGIEEHRVEKVFPEKNIMSDVISVLYGIKAKPAITDQERCSCRMCGLELNKDICHIEDSFSRYTLYYPQKHTINRMQRADYVLFDLKQFKNLPQATYTQKDVDILVKILRLADNMGAANKYTAVQKLITKADLLNATGNEINVILGVLSVCGVFQTAKHKGYREVFTPYADREFVGYETELFYPLFHWRGKNGVNTKALLDIFPRCVAEAFVSDDNDLSLDQIYLNHNHGKNPRSRAEDAFVDGKHIIELNDRRRACYGLATLDAGWHREVRFSVTHTIYKRTEVFFEGNSIKKIIYEEKRISDDGTFTGELYRERDMCAETEDMYFLLPKTSRGKKKPWTPSLLDSFTYVGPSLDVDIGRGYLHSYNWQNNKKLPIPEGTKIRSAIEFYTFTDEFLRNLPDDYEEILRDFKSSRCTPVT